jgi:peptide/nickel transport system permease protein
MSDATSRRGRIVGLTSSLDTTLSVWFAVGVVLFLLQAGAVGTFLTGLIADFLGIVPTADASSSLLASVTEVFESLQRQSRSVPTLLSRDVVPNGGYWNGEEWVGTFLGLSPAVSWAIRVGLVYLYSFAWVAWVVFGYRYYRREIRVAD